MAQARRKRAPTTPLAPRIVRLLRETALYATGALAAYVLISLLSHSPADPGWSHAGAGGGINNLGGQLGAWIADLCFLVLGKVAYVLPAVILLVGWRIYASRAEPAEHRSRRIWMLHGGGFLAGMVGAGGLEALHFARFSTGTPYAAGGLVGEVTSTFLRNASGDLGASLFLLVLFFGGVSVFTDISWLRVMDVVGEWSLKLYARVSGLLSAFSDRLAGRVARQHRQESVAQLRERLQSQKAVRIEPGLKPRAESKKARTERQGKLFATPEGINPPLSLLDPAQPPAPAFSNESLQTMSRLLEKKLRDFNVEVTVVGALPGPVITRFELEPAPGIKARQIGSLAKDLARALSVVSVRVVDNIPGKSVVGLEIPNEVRETVSLIQGLSAQVFEQANTPLPLMLGKDISGTPVIADLCKMPHLLIGGTTGSGKSVCINALVLSLLYKSTPDEVRLLMVDPKMLELNVYEGIPHLLAPVVTDMQQAGHVLRWCIGEMERRYQLMAALRVRNIGGYNRKVRTAREQRKPLADPLTAPGEEPRELTTLPYIVLIIDELADLMMVVGKKVEELIARLAQRARASGIHLILATQRPSVDVITGLIKANIPARIAFQVSARVDSRTILDQIGAEHLLGHGDMLYLPPGMGLPLRIHGAFVSDQEVNAVAAHLKKAGQPVYNEKILEPDEQTAAGGLATDGETDPLYDEALKLVTESRRASVSAVQRRLRIGYNRAARMIEAMEQAGVVGPLQSNGKREVLAPPPPS